jgi:hypothetical protein
MASVLLALLADGKVSLVQKHEAYGGKAPRVLDFSSQ